MKQREINGKRAVGLVVFLAASLVPLALLPAVGSAKTLTPRAQTAQLSKYTQAAKAAEKPALWQGPTAKANAPQGKKITVVTCTEALQGCALLTKGAVSAADALGWKTKVIDVTNSTGYNQAVETAVAQGANGIILVSVDAHTIVGGLAAAHAKHIPVVSIFQDNPVTKTGVGAEVSPNATQQGQVLADYMISTLQGKAHVLLLNDPEFLAPTRTLVAVKNQLNKCTVCSIDFAPQINFTSADIGSTLANEVVGALRNDPTINAIVLGFDVPALEIVPAIDAAGLQKQAKIYTQLGTTAALGDINKGDVVAADVSASAKWGGWAGVDELVRAFDHQPYIAEHVPSVLIVAGNVPSSGQPYVGLSSGFVQKYQKLWGR
jgi:ribose transport system substrate-binding protein